MTRYGLTILRSIEEWFTQFFKEKCERLLEDEEHIIKLAFREGCWETGQFMTEELADKYYDQKYGI